MFIAPAVPVARDTVPIGDDWLHQPKLDGWRVQLHRSGDSVRIFTRKGLDLAGRLPCLCGDLRGIRGAFVIDAELILPTVPCGVDFEGIARAMRVAEGTLAVSAFDLLSIRGKDVRDEPLVDRLERLEALLDACKLQRVMRCEAFVDGAALLQACEEHGHERVVSKPKVSRYRSGTRSGWVKTKTAAWKAINAER